MKPTKSDLLRHAANLDLYGKVDKEISIADWHASVRFAAQFMRDVAVAEAYEVNGECGIGYELVDDGSLSVGDLLIKSPLEGE